MKVAHVPLRADQFSNIEAGGQFFNIFFFLLEMDFLRPLELPLLVELFVFGGSVAVESSCFEFLRGIFGLGYFFALSWSVGSSDFGADFLDKAGRCALDEPCLPPPSEGNLLNFEGFGLWLIVGSF